MTAANYGRFCASTVTCPLEPISFSRLLSSVPHMPSFVPVTTENLYSMRVAEANVAVALNKKPYPEIITILNVHYLKASED
jgi:hypothetical protein